MKNSFNIARSVYCITVLHDAGTRRIGRKGRKAPRGLQRTGAVPVLLTKIVRYYSELFNSSLYGIKYWLSTCAFLLALTILASLNDLYKMVS
jgi:hypothetical protein